MSALERRVFLMPSLSFVKGDRHKSLLRGQPVMYALSPSDKSLESTSNALAQLGIPSKPRDELNPFKLRESEEEICRRVATLVTDISSSSLNLAVIAHPRLTHRILGAIGASIDHLPRMGEVYLLGPRGNEGVLQHKTTLLLD